jgi:hypothetical protein
MDFAIWLRRELKVRGWGVRTLARKINPENPEIPRRALNHYMRGSRPTEPYAVAIAKAFALDRSELPIEEAAPTGDPFSGSSGEAPSSHRPDRRRGAGTAGEVAA